MSRYLISFDDYDHLWETSENCEFCESIDNIYKQCFSLIEFINKYDKFILTKEIYNEKLSEYCSKYEQDSHLIFYVKDFLNSIYCEIYNNNEVLLQLINIQYDEILNNFKNKNISFEEYLNIYVYDILINNKKNILNIFKITLQHKLKYLDTYYIVDGYSLLLVYERYSKNLIKNIEYLKTIPTNHSAFMNEVHRQYNKENFQKTIAGDPHSPTLIHSRWCQKCGRRKPSIYDSEREIKDYGKNE